jgi:hypothetical protein
MLELETNAETRAQAAQTLPTFSDLNLLGVKSKVHEVLKLIGRDGFFRTYTLHDVSHIDKMLGMLDWVVPPSTQDAMSPSDWLLIVLATYFHDMGMLVTQEEFEARNNSGFREYCDEHLFAGEDGADYRSKVDALGADADRFLYEEFVRAHHAERIGDWIRGRSSPHLGYSPDAASQVAEVLQSLPAVFRDDLARVCESHHLSDLADTAKYRTDQPYGDSDSETANVQYAAILLRTADLLHVTSDRTPSVAFRIINPQDPVSQREWAKQEAVRRVRAQKGKDRDGAFTETAPRDTIEVIAEFQDAEGFFGLTSYLRYAGDQLRQSFEWARASAAEFDLPHAFPWRHLDDSGVTASGFSPQRLSFTLDQARILDLLTGHTLYNDTSVVIRELTQNAIDAARLQAFIDGVAQDTMNVHVEWDSDKRELVVRDSGTGMTQAVIENNLLKAGASRYQEEEFQKKYTLFSPISRFGIGVLSAFMIADSVEIVTSAPEEAQARALTLRSVHGRYLVQLLDKETDERARRIGAHGTEIRLTLRESAKLPDIWETLRRWVVIPRCQVTAAVDGEDPKPVGFASPARAIGAALEAAGITLHTDGEPADGAIRVLENVSDSVTTAYAVVWSRFFGEWAFLQANQLIAKDARPALGTCVEGIRVEESTAGYADTAIVAMSNACGLTAPKTNVARSGLEATPQRTEMLRAVYGAYLSHVAGEAEALGTTRGLSLTWAAQEAEFMLRPLMVADPRYEPEELKRPIEQAILTNCVRSAPIILVEREGTRGLERSTDLQREDVLWTVDSAYVRAAERLLREIPGAVSLSSVSEGFGTDAFDLPDGVTLAGYQSSSPLYQTALDGWEVQRLVIRRNERRVDLAWSKLGGSGRWLSLLPPDRTRRSRYRRYLDPILVANSSVDVAGREGEVAVRAHGVFFLFPDSALAKFLSEELPRLSEDRSLSPAREFLAQCVGGYLNRSRPPEKLRDFVEAVAQQDPEGAHRPLASLESVLDVEQLIAALSDTPMTTFDTQAWARRDTDTIGF